MSQTATDINNILGFMFQLAGKVLSVIQAGKISFFDLPSFIGVFEAVGPALSSVKNLPTDLKTLSDADLTAIRAYVATQLPTVVPNETIDGLINNGLAQAQALYDYVQTFKIAQTPVASAPVSA